MAKLLEIVEHSLENIRSPRMLQSENEASHIAEIGGQKRVWCVVIEISKCGTGLNGTKLFISLSCYAWNYFKNPSARAFKVIRLISVLRYTLLPCIVWTRDHLQNHFWVISYVVTCPLMVVRSHAQRLDAWVANVVQGAYVQRTLLGSSQKQGDDLCDEMLQVSTGQVGKSGYSFVDFWEKEKLLILHYLVPSKKKKIVCWP